MEPEQRYANQHAQFGLGHDLLKSDFLSKLPETNDIIDPFDRYEAIRLVATEQEWSLYKRIGWVPVPLFWAYMNSEDRAATAYAQLLGLLKIFYARIRRHLKNSELIATGLCRATGSRRTIQPDEWVVLGNFLKDGIARSDSNEVSDFVFRRTPQLEPGRSNANMREVEAIEWLTQWADKNCGRQRAEDIDTLLRAHFPQANFSERALVRIHKGANLHARGILGSGPIARN